MKKLIYFFSLLFPLLVHATVYKGLDDKGNVFYSDTPFVNAKKIQLPTLPVVTDSENNTRTPKSTSDKKQTPDKTVSYTKLTITSPKNQQTIWNNNKLAVSLAISPALNKKGGDYIQLLMDAKPVVKKSTQLTLQIGYVERGEHQLQLMIRNKNNKPIKRSNPITVYIKHTIVPKPAPEKL